MQRNRAWRRAQRDRKIQQVYNWMNERNWYIHNNSTDTVRRKELLMETARLRHGAPKCCSNWCCGNPRRHYGTRKLNEQRFDLFCEDVYAENLIRKDFVQRSKRW